MAEYRSRHTGSTIDNAVDKANRLPSDLGTSGQVLKSTGNGIEWGDMPTGGVGPPGPKGDPYTLTVEDKAAIVDAVLAALPNGDSEVY